MAWTKATATSNSTSVEIDADVLSLIASTIRPSNAGPSRPATAPITTTPRVSATGSRCGRSTSPRNRRVSRDDATGRVVA